MMAREPCKPLLVSYGGRETVCYWPDEIERAEDRLPFMPVRPMEAVQRVTHLSLTQVLLKTGPGPECGKSIRDVTYIFGEIPGGSGGIPDPSPSEPKFVVVNEQLEPSWPAEPQLDRTVYHSSRRGSPETRTSYGNWQFRAGLPGGVHILITANFDRDVVEALGRSIMGKAPMERSRGDQPTE